MSCCTELSGKAERTQRKITVILLFITFRFLFDPCPARSTAISQK